MEGTSKTELILIIALVVGVGALLYMWVSSDPIQI